MCSGSKSRLSSSSFGMEGEFQKQNDEFFCDCSVLLELSAMDDLEAFRSEVEEKGLDVNEASFWYGRRIGSKKMAFEKRTPLLIAAMFGSVKVLKYMIETGKVDVNRVCGSDRVTALHCAVAGGTNASVGIIKLLLDACADATCVNANGNKPVDLIGPASRSPSNSNRKAIELLLKGDVSIGESDQITTEEEDRQKIATPQLSKEGVEKKEYPIDVSLPDINNGIYGTDEFRMYTFKVKPCSRAYSHDWTECPFVHPGENARRRDPRKYPYSCVPCPEFRKGTCQKGDACEYAHGVFESWLHPAQYRTRICKDETGCARKVCFFAHKAEELRPVYASTGSAMPSPKSHSAGGLDMTVMSPLALSSSSMPMPATSTPPMSPLAAASSPKSGNMWQNKLNLTPPALQLPGSRLKTALSARDLDLEMELLGLESHASQQQQLIDEITRLSSPSPSPSYWNKEFNRMGDLKPSNLDDIFGSLDSSMLSQLQGLSIKPTTPTQLQSPNGLQMRQNMNQLRASYPTNLSSSPARKPSSFGFDSSAAVAAAVMNSRSASFAKRSQSFIDRGAGTHRPGLTSAGNSASMMPSTRSDWSSPDGKLDWGIQGDELNKLKKSASFRFRDNNVATTTLMQSGVNEPDVSWVNSLVKDVSHESSGHFGTKKAQYNHGNGGEILPPWLEQLYIEQEQMVA
ncbi:zinc finger CCCH domain-containing protein 29-like isoform X1 [Juglans microcarpa x Juglans regia]|uniref:zinc finger CCCH domain-containing protein 29-like isoform X1 n=2 Tax=Juglans microcarpa x Juglans regia TaxID=2249226 RepID=UPI001B7E6C63|nr:zinc finger CCCH domain-containing protein 29-like isoform X1 [Juglans microcarpa x Juglans regia]